MDRRGRKGIPLQVSADDARVFRFSTRMAEWSIRFAPGKPNLVVSAVGVADSRFRFRAGQVTASDDLTTVWQSVR
jgi:hypothetical protein